MVQMPCEGQPLSRNECSFTAPVSTLEFLGAEYYAGLNLGGCVITCRIPAAGEISHGQKLEAVFDANKAYFFDEESGLRLKGNA